MQQLFQSFLSSLSRFARDKRAVTAIEYGILAAGVAVVIGSLVSSDGPFSHAIANLFDSIMNQLPQQAGK